MMCTLRRDKSFGAVHHPLLAMDIENNSETGVFICASLYGERKDHHGTIHQIDEFFTTQDALCNRILYYRDSAGKKNNPFWIVVFNGGYDHIFLESIIDDSTLFYAGSRFITARIRPEEEASGKSKKGIKIIDMCNHVDGSLEQWIEYLEMEKKYGIKKESLDNIEIRNRSDTIATWYLATFIEDYYYSLGISMKLTVGSCALNLYRKKFFKLFFIRESDFINDYERKALRGGRVEIFERGSIHVRSFDVNSMYLSVMEKEYIPDPGTYRYYENTKNWETHFNSEMLGIFHVKVSAPKQKIMVLPYFEPKLKKLIFPYGEFSGYWTSIELHESIKNGYKVIECYDYVIYTQKHKMFSEYASYIWEQRQKFKKEKNKGMDLLTKKLGNSLFGKFVQKNRGGGYAGKLSDFDGDIGERAITSIRDGIEYIVFSDSSFEESEHSFPVIGVFITSYARIKLYRKMKEHEETIVYCDTDSVKYRIEDEDGGEDMNDDKSLGGWGFEYEKTLPFFKPKMYGNEKIKGVPKRAKVYSDISTHTVHAEYEKPNRWRESIRRGLIPNKWEKVDKEISLSDDKRVWINDNHSEPINLDDVTKNNILLNEEQLTKYAKTLKRPKKEPIDKDLIDYEAYDDSTLSDHENKELEKNRWKEYINIL